MQNIYFIRHGESEANQNHICAGRTDVELTPLGMHQAKEVGLELASSGIEIDLIVSSPLKRALDTAKEIARAINYPELKIVIRQEATERYGGDFEGHPLVLQRGIPEDQRVARGVESIEAMKLRTVELASFLRKRPEGNILVVSHNQFGRSFVAYLEHKSRDAVERLPNAHIMKINQIEPA